MWYIYYPEGLYYVFDDWKHSETSQMSSQKIQNYRFNIEEKFYITCSHRDITEKNINWSYTTITH
jgi:hypothetical protein